MVFVKYINTGKGVNRMKKEFLLAIGCLLLPGCVVKDYSPVSSEQKQQPVKVAFTIKDYYPLANKIYSFRGEGNEFAAYKETFFSQNGSYLPSIVENGGTRLFKVYELTSDGIYVVYEQAEYYKEAPASIDSVKSQFIRKPLLTIPLEIGRSFDGWEIKEVDKKITLPSGEMTNVIVTEQRDKENHTVITNYWAPGYGKILQVFLSTDGKEENQVVSELEKIE